jgi:hypothetical protein
LVNDGNRLTLLILPKEVKGDRPRHLVHGDEGKVQMVLVRLTDKPTRDLPDRSHIIEQVFHDRRDSPGTDNHIGEGEAAWILSMTNRVFFRLESIDLLAAHTGDQASECPIILNIDAEARITRGAVPN